MIKFRAWYDLREIMVYQGDEDIETLQSFMFHYGDDELMQSTNILDKNGKEIFENDYLKYGNYNLKVIRVNGGSWLDGMLSGPCAEKKIQTLMHQCEVIGNCYENTYEG